MSSSNEAAKDTRLTQAERTEISDQRMFDAAVTLINLHGPAGTSLSDVGVLAGYSRGLASHRFGSKESLFDFVVRRVGDIWLEQLKQCSCFSLDFSILLKRYFHSRETIRFSKKLRIILKGNLIIH